MEESGFKPRSVWFHSLNLTGCTWVIFWWISRLRKGGNQDHLRDLIGGAGKSSPFSVLNMLNHSVFHFLLSRERKYDWFLASQRSGFPWICYLTLNQLVEWGGLYFGGPSQGCSGVGSPRRPCLRSTVETAVLSFLGAGTKIAFVLFAPVSPIA